ncbi:salicylate hydroxylase [Nemania sp. NC0429]|nr:salicylate hydroxylase [Nemania sp. NC0429]
MTHSRIRIAIVGGGLAGATLANTLTQLQYADVEVFESAPEFSERGAAIILTSLAQKSLLRATSSAKEILSKAGAVPMRSTRVALGSGSEAGTVVFDMGNTGDPGVVIHRASLLRELLAPLPAEILHTGKKLTSLTSSDTGVLLKFEDETCDHFDAVIGADGVFGTVRRHVIGDDAFEKYAASPAGFWDCRNLVPYEEAKEKLGEQFFEQDRQYGWLGDNAFIMHDILENRTMVQCVISAVETQSPKERKVLLNREILMDTLGKWLEGPVAKGMIDLILDQPNPYGYSEWEHKATPSYKRGRVCIIGDAAHATSPWQASGASMAIEDAMILGFLFRHVSSAKDIDSAFEAFDYVRRPRCERIIHSSRHTGEIFCGQDKEVGLNLNKLRAALSSKWDVVQLDHETHEKEALDKMEEILERERG